jgi:hypothetical protein
MKSKAILAASLLFLPLVGALPSHAQSRMAPPLACWAGYHPDKDGNCQPNIPETPRYCDQPGLIYQPAPWGWSCVPAPQGY